MRLGMMQPYFFPYLGYFGLIHATDYWVVFDTPQYIRRGWVNRNRVLSNGQPKWKYARVPVTKTDRSTAIKDIKIATLQDWRRDFFNQLDTYRIRRAPQYHSTLAFLKHTLAVPTDNLAVLLTHCLKATCERFELPFRCEIFSTSQLRLPDINDPGRWALETARALGATEYINPPGGRELFDATKFHDAGVTLKFLEPTLTPYQQGATNFQPGLSIIDVMMWNNTLTVKRMVSEYQLKAA